MAVQELMIYTGEGWKGTGVNGRKGFSRALEEKLYFQEIFQELYNFNPGVCGNVDKHIQQEINQEYLPFEQIQGQYAEGCSLHSSGTALLDSVQFAP